MANEVNKTQVERFGIVEIKPGVYFRYNSLGYGDLTDDITKAKRYNDLNVAERRAKNSFGEVKTLRVTWEVEQHEYFKN